jgi:hypothetical protein
MAYEKKNKERGCISYNKEKKPTPKPTTMPTRRMMH